MAKGRLKNKIKDKVQKAKDKVNKAKDKVKNLSAKVQYAKLLPFKPIMVKALKNKGMPVSMATKMEKLVPLFTDVIIKKKTKQNFEDYEPMNTYGDAHLEHLAAEAAQAAVDFILSFIKQLKDKKDRGEALSPDEQNILEGAEKVADAAEDAAKSGAKNWFADLWYIWVALIALLLIFAVKKK